MDQISDEFVNDIKQYITLDNQLRQTQKNSREIRKKYLPLRQSILNYMDNNGMKNKDINISDGKLIYETFNKKPDINKTIIKNNIALYFEQELLYTPLDATHMATKVTDFIYNERESIKKCTLKIKYD